MHVEKDFAYQYEISWVELKAALALNMVLKSPQASTDMLLKECMFITHMFPRAWHAVRLEKSCNHINNLCSCHTLPKLFMYNIVEL